MLQLHSLMMCCLIRSSNVVLDVVCFLWQFADNLYRCGWNFRSIPMRMKIWSLKSTIARHSLRYEWRHSSFDFFVHFPPLLRSQSTLLDMTLVDRHRQVENSRLEASTCYLGQKPRTRPHRPARLRSSGVVGLHKKMTRLSPRLWWNTTHCIVS